MFYNFMENEQMNFQLNRLVFYGDESVIPEVKEIVPQIKDFETWYQQFIGLAKKAESEGRYVHAGYYYRMAEFYLTSNRPEKHECYIKFIENFYKVNINKPIERFKVPYENTFLPAWRMEAKGEKGIIVIHGGYDSFVEEFLLAYMPLNEEGYTLIYFEGPGQGTARKNGLTFCYNWERPTSAILDYFQLNDITLLGISWGGYLCLRAAAFEKRIKNVISFDIFYCGMDGLNNKITHQEQKVLLSLLKNNEKDTLNKVFQEKMNSNLDFNWKITQGMYITGAETPFDFLKSIEKHTMVGIEDKITQNVLLLAGEEDQYVPVERMDVLRKNLVNARSLRSKVYTKETGGEQHCQVGYLNLVIDEILDFLRNIR